MDTSLTAESAETRRARLLARARDVVRRPETRTDLVQVVKATLATVGAWVLADQVLDLHQAFLAGWTALLTVHATVYRSFWRGGQSVVATVLGILLSFAATQALGYNVLSLGVAVLVGLVVARTPLIRDEGVAVATTALFVITSGVGSDEVLLLDRMLDTVVGVAVGLLVNLVVVPPLDDRVAERALDDAARRLGRLLTRMGTDLRHDLDTDSARQWIEDTREIDEALDHAQQQLGFTQESQWANPRRRRSPRTTDVGEATALLVRLEEGVAQGRAIARIIDESVVEARTWDDGFRERWTALLREVGERVADPDREVRSLRQSLDELTDDLSGEDLPGLQWPIYGALITALHNVVTVVDDVASHRDGLRPA